MGDLRTRILLDLTGNLERRAKRYSGALDKFSKKGRRSMAMLGKGARAAGRGLDRIGNRYTALLTGAAGLGTARMVMNLEDRFVRLGIQANASAGEIDHLKEEIYQAARAPEIRLDPGEITSAIEEIIEKTGDLGFAEENIRNIGLAISATGAAGKDIGGIMAEFQKMGIIDPKQVMEALDILNVQGKEGAFTLQNLANLGPRVVTAYTATGRGGVEAIREMGAALQVIRQGTGAPEQAATAFEAIMATMADAKKIKLLQKGGIKVFDEKELKAGKEVLRPINELMVEIVKATKGRQTLLGKVFDREAIRAFNAAASEYKRTGSVGMMNKFMEVQGDGVTTLHDSARAAETGNRALRQLYVAWEQFADSRLTGPIRELTEMLNSVDQKTVDRWLKLGTGMAVGLGGLVVANKTLRAGKGVWDMVRRIRGGKGKGGAGKGGFGDAMPVYVVNSGGSAGGGGVFGPGGGFAPKAAAGGAALAGGVALVGAVAIGAGIAISQASKAHGWGAKTYMAGDKEREVMGLGGAHDLAKALRRPREKLMDAADLLSLGVMKPAGSWNETMRGEVVVRVKAERGTEARTDELRSSHDNFDLQAETEVGVVSGGGW